MFGEQKMENKYLKLIFLMKLNLIKLRALLIHPLI
jgi:hypothetical protein